MMIFDLKRNATTIRKSIDCIDDCSCTIGRSINRQGTWMAGSRLAKATRPTYHDPPADDVELAHLPPALFGSLSASISPYSPGESRPPSSDCVVEYE